MKSSVSLLFLFLVVAGCKDATNAPTGLLPPDNLSRAERGNPPPPPVDAAIFVCVSGGGCALFEGEYMAQTTGLQPASFLRAAPGEGVCVFPGHAFLKIDRQITDEQLGDGTTSGNAAIKCSHQRASGQGTIEIGGVEVDLDQVVLFENPPDCTERCGQFIARDEEGNEIASGQIFEREFFDEFCDIGEGIFCGSGGD